MEGARLGGEDFLLAERVTALGPCVYAPGAVVYHRPRGSLSAVLRWFMRRGESEIALLRTTTNRGNFMWFLLRSSWSLRIVGLLALCAAWPHLLPLLPIAIAVYYGALLWRFRFARAIKASTRSRKGSGSATRTCQIVGRPVSHPAGPA